MKGTIALLVPRLHNGGAEKVAADMSVFLSRAGYKIVFLLDEYDERRSYCHVGKEVVIKTDSYWNEGSMLRQFYHFCRRAKVFKEYKLRYRVDISISFMLEDNLTNIMADAGDRKIVTVHCVTSHMEEFKGQLFAKKNIIKWMYPRADAVIVVSEYVKQDLVKNFGLHRKAVKVIYNSVDEVRLLDMAKEPLEEKYSKNLILFVGRLDDDKRPWVVVRAMQEVISYVPDAQLLMLGDGANQQLLRKLIRRFHLEDNVKLLGFRDNVAKYMANAKALVMCSIAEAFPCTLVEALTLRLPVIANDCPGGIREIISTERLGKGCKDNRVVTCGILTPMIVSEKENCDKKKLSREEECFAQAICTLLKDEALREQLSANAKINSINFVQNQIVEKWLKMLKL